MLIHKGVAPVVGNGHPRLVRRSPLRPAEQELLPNSPPHFWLMHFPRDVRLACRPEDGDDVIAAARIDPKCEDVHSAPGKEEHVPVAFTRVVWPRKLPLLKSLPDVYDHRGIPRV